MPNIESLTGFPNSLSNCQIRFWSVADVDELCRIANNPLVSQYLRNHFPYPYSRTDAESWCNFAKIESIISRINTTVGFNQGLELCIADKSTGVCIGGVTYNFVELYGELRGGIVSIGYWLSQERWNQGIMTKAVRFLIQFIREHEATARIIEAEVCKGNNGSCKLLEKLGFVKIGEKKDEAERNGVVYDILIFHFIL